MPNIKTTKGDQRGEGDLMTKEKEIIEKHENIIDAMFQKYWYKRYGMNRHRFRSALQEALSLTEDKAIKSIMDVKNKAEKIMRRQKQQISDLEAEKKILNNLLDKLEQCEVNGCKETSIIRICDNHMNTEYPCIECEKLKAEKEEMLEKIIILLKGYRCGGHWKLLIFLEKLKPKKETDSK